VAYQAFEPDPVGRVERPFIENCREALDFVVIKDAEGLELGVQLINLVRVRRFFERRRFVKRLEGKLDVLDLILKIEDIGPLLARSRAIKAGERGHS